MKILVSWILLFSALAVAGSSGAPHFLKESVKLGKETLEVELADTEEKRGYGLMFRKQIQDGSGMLFVFEDESPRGF